MSHEENVLERASALWKNGDWGTLANLDEATIRNHPDRAHLAILAAIGHQRIGHVDTAQKLLRLALDWKVEKEVAGEFVVGLLYHCIELLAAITKERDAAPSAREADAGAEHPGVSSAPDASTESDVFSPEAYAFYQRISEAPAGKEAPSFILLDCKSLPRSGLHYLKGILARLLDSRFSFCEWYYECGCCRRMPCALTGFAEGGDAGARYASVRLTKSHDLDLADPSYDPVRSARRVILLRHPLYILTSYFALDCLNHYAASLRKHAINLEKIWLHHEPEVLRAAYRVVDECFEEPTPEMLHSWLDLKSAYILAFLKKWVPPSSSSPLPYLHVVHYEDIDRFVLSLLGEISGFLPGAAQQRIRAFAGGSERFAPRTNPFQVPSQALSDYIGRNFRLFEEAAHRILAAEEGEPLRLRYGTSRDQGRQ